jgi:hypothetical protein
MEDFPTWHVEVQGVAICDWTIPAEVFQRGIAEGIYIQCSFRDIAEARQLSDWLVGQGIKAHVVSGLCNGEYRRGYHET